VVKTNKHANKSGISANIENHTFIRKFVPEVKLRDIIQVLVGASILAIPVGFTEETWRLGQTLPWANIFGLFAMSVLFITLFVYYTYHKQHENFSSHVGEFIKRIVVTYVFSFLIVALLLTLIHQAPFATEPLIALKRIIIVTFPASMSAAVADAI